MPRHLHKILIINNYHAPGETQDPVHGELQVLSENVVASNMYCHSLFQPA